MIPDYFIKFLNYLSFFWNSKWELVFLILLIFLLFPFEFASTCLYAFVRTFIFEILLSLRNLLTKEPEEKERGKVQISIPNILYLYFSIACHLFLSLIFWISAEFHMNLGF